jgi:uncharacterized protein
VLTCSRCLREFPWAYDVSFVENCALQEIDDPAVYATGEDEEDPIPIVDEELVDLTELVRQMIALDVPFQPLCKPDCGGLCQKCGAVLDEGGCRCEADAIDPRWAKLRGLLDE